MIKLWKNVSVLWAVGMALGMSGLALGATGTGPYYATPSWDQQLPAATRFVVLSNWGNGNEAVLDRETGLVWEQSPSTTGELWLNASQHCVQLSKGGRKGWRLPTVQDLASLIDPTQTNPPLPSGHPFTAQSSDYWSASSDAFNAAGAWVVSFINGDVYRVNKSVGGYYAWCVRGGPGVDPQ
jgi:hypothetical protein